MKWGKKTDGSIDPESGRVGVAMTLVRNNIFNGQEKNVRIHNCSSSAEADTCSSSAEAEIVAILLALTAIMTSSQDIVIFTHSMSSLMSLNTGKSAYPYLISEIRNI